MSKEAEEPSLVHPTTSPGPTSPFLFLLQNTQFIVTALTFAFLLHLHSLHALWFCAGTLVALGSAKLLKRCIRQPRPTGAKNYERTYGMPSTHSSSMAYYGVYLALASLAFRPVHGQLLALFPSAASSALVREQEEVALGLAALSAITAGTVCWSRVRLGHHTPPQVLAGAALGSLVALVWFLLWTGTSQLTFLPRPPSQLAPLSKGLGNYAKVAEPQLEALVRRWLQGGWARGEWEIATAWRELGVLWNDVARKGGEEL